jgi:hypothetical protein
MGGSQVIPASTRYPARLRHLWHHGENDFVSGTGELEYTRMFRSLVMSIRRHSDAPVYVSVGTLCGINVRWLLDNPVARAQRALPDAELNIRAGVDTDSLMNYVRSPVARFRPRWPALLTVARVFERR